MAQDAGGKGQMPSSDPERFRIGAGFAQELVLYAIKPCPDLIIVL